MRAQEGDRHGLLLGRRFRLESEVGRGQEAVVWRAWDERRQVRVAIKMLRADPRPSSAARCRLRHEASVLTALQHPHIVSLIGGAAEDAEPWVVLEWLEGRTLEDYVGESIRKGQLPSLDWVTTVMAQLASALAYTHARGTIHRDVKPSNVLVRSIEGTHVTLLDFGLAVDSKAGPSAAKGPLGSVAYMSPEQARAEDVDGRTDVFSLGVVAFELLTGRRCWALAEDGRPAWALPGVVPANELNTKAAVLERAEAGIRPRPSSFRPSSPPGLDEWFQQAVHPELSQRFLSVEHMFGAFSEIMSRDALLQE